MIIISVVSMLLLAIGFASILAIADKKLKVKEDPRIEQVSDILPQANCAACGYASCHQFAELLVSGQVKDPALCRVSNQEDLQEIADLLGYKLGEVLPVKARILCGGGEKEAKNKGLYSGAEDCLAASLLSGGYKTCDYGCLGLATCVKACPFDAIFIDNNRMPRIIDEKCTGCGLCVDACPKNVIELLPTASEYYVKCASQDKGAVSRKACSVSCIGCQKCVKVCEPQAIDFENNLAKIEPKKCNNCGACFEVCPTKCILINNSVKLANKKRTAI